MNQKAGGETALIERGPELAEISRLLQTVSQGTGAALVFAGPLGVGKSSVLAEAAAMAGRLGAAVLSGRASPIGESLAYGLILDALRSPLWNLDTTRRASLVVGLPELGRLFPGLGLPAPEPLADSALAKTQLFESVVRLLERLARQQPLLLCLDDLQWADPQSLELLGYLVRGLTGLRAGILCTCRTGDTVPARNLRAFLKSLERDRLARVVEIGRLSIEGITALAASALGGPPPQELISLLEERTRGIPLFAYGVIRALLDAGALTRVAGSWWLDTGTAAPLPDGLRDLLLDRLAQLAPAERSLVDLLAVSGTATDYETLAHAAAQPEAELLPTLEALMRQGLITETETGSRVTYELAHPLYQETAYAALPALSRRRLHGRVIAAMNARGAAEASRLAVHYLGAGPLADREQALNVYLAAAEEARTVYAHDAAARYLTAALDRVREGHRPALLPQLLTQLGEALQGLGEVHPAIKMWQEALAALQPSSLAERARLHLRIGLAEYERGRLSESLQDTQRARELMAACTGPTLSREQAEAYYHEVFLRIRAEDYAGALQVSAELDRLVEAVPSSDAMPLVWCVRQVAAMYRNQPQPGISYGQKALAHSLPRAAEHRARFWLAWAYGQLGEFETARQLCEQNLELARQVGDPALELTSWNLLMQMALVLGDWDWYRPESTRLLQLASRSSPRHVVGVRTGQAIIHAWQGDFPAAAEGLAAVKALCAGWNLPFAYVSWVHTAEILLAWEQGNMEHVRAVLTAAEPLRVLHALPEYFIRVGAWAAVGEPEQARRTLALLPDESPLKAALTAMATGLGGQSEANREAADRFDQLGLRFFGARARLAWAAAQAQVAGPEATAAVRQALDVFERLGANGYAEKARQLLRELGVALPVRPAPKGDGLLSPREWEVACLVAEGLSNAAVAARLVISERTVTTHLQRIYSRVRLSSRRELAAYVAARRTNT